MKIATMMCLLLMFLFTQNLFSQIPKTMSYQGVLSDAAGNPIVDGNINMTFRLYDSENSGEFLWEESQTVDITNSIFNVILGSTVMLNLPFDKQYWLGITVDEEPELSPRIILTSSPYSLGSTSTVTEPAPGQSFIIRNTIGEATHEMSPDGNSTHIGIGTFIDGIDVGVWDDSTDGFDLNNNVLLKTNKINGPGGIAARAKGPTAGVYGYSKTGSGLYGYSSSGRGVSGLSDSGIGIFGKSDTGPAGKFEGDVLIESNGRLSIDNVPIGESDKFLVWGADKFVKYKTLPSNEQQIWQSFPNENTVKVLNSDGSTAVSIMKDANPSTEYTQDIFGNLTVRGLFEANSKNFRIDHPLDPENKFLRHASVESSEMKNIYDGKVVLNNIGEAKVVLPEWFEALNTEFRYQLTPIGSPGPNLHISEEINNNQFTISGGTSGMNVSWQVTGIRHDKWSLDNPLQVESTK